MAERSVLTLAQKPLKTQESMRAKLEEWRKAKQQQTAKQLKQQPRGQQPVPLKTPNRVKSRVFQQKATSIQPKSKRASLSKPSILHRKRKSAGADKITAEEPCQSVNDELNIKESKREHSKIQKEYLSEDPMFNSKPPETFEIEIAPDPKKARRSTFTLETPIKDISEKSKENTKPCEKNQQNLSGKNATKTMDPGKCKQVCSANNIQGKQRFIPKKNGPSTQARKVSQIAKSKVELKGDKVNLPRTPVKLLKPHMNKSLSMRERLELWRKENGKEGGVTKTPATLRRKSTMTSRRKVHQPITMETQEQLHLEPFDTMNCDTAEKELMPEEIRKKLQNCLGKIQEDKANDDMIAIQLDEIQNSHPGSLQCAEFWISRAKIAEHEEDDGRVVCLYEQALVFNAEPEHLIKEAVAEYSRTRKGQEEESLRVLPVEVPDAAVSIALPVTPVTTPRVDDALMKQVGKPSPFDSSIIKYSVTKATPFKSRLKSCERPVVTPVRRSARLERRSVHYPTMLQEHGLAVRHLDDLPEDIKKDVLFKPNFTLQNDLNDAWKDLWNE